MSRVRSGSLGPQKDLLLGHQGGTSNISFGEREDGSARVCTVKCSCFSSCLNRECHKRSSVNAAA